LGKIGGVLLAGGLVTSCGAAASDPPGRSDSRQIADGSITLNISGGAIEIALASKPAGVSQDQIVNWIGTAARAVSGYCGKFPVKRVTIDISMEGDGHDVSGRTYDGRRIEIGLPKDLTQADLADDWIMTHEMFHLAFPDLAEKHLWMNEGLSTYLEPIARARIGTLTPERVWKDVVEGMPNSQPEPGDRGLDQTHTWGRTYWGGCLYWLLADIEIREQTHGHKSLEDVIRTVLDAGGDGSQQWKINRVIAVGDAATGTKVLSDLYEQMARKSKSTDLGELWKKLGIRYQEGRVTFDDTAPLAEVRRSITARVN
jgi:hypothetical protein